MVYTIELFFVIENHREEVFYVSIVVSVLPYLVENVMVNAVVVIIELRC